MKYTCFIGLPVMAALVCCCVKPVQAAKVWDPYTAIEFVVSGDDDPLPPSYFEDNGPVTTDFTADKFHDVDHWIDPDESVPNNEGYPSEDLPYSDIEYTTDAAPPGGLVADVDANGNLTGTFTFTMTGVNGNDTCSILFTGNDNSQTIAQGESGTRNDPDNLDNWWDDPGQDPGGDD